MCSASGRLCGIRNGKICHGKWECLFSLSLRTKRPKVCQRISSSLRIVMHHINKIHRFIRFIKMSFIYSLNALSSATISLNRKLFSIFTKVPCVHCALFPFTPYEQRRFYLPLTATLTFIITGSIWASLLFSRSSRTVCSAKWWNCTNCSPHHLISFAYLSCEVARSLTQSHTCSFSLECPNTSLSKLNNENTLP